MKYFKVTWLNKKIIKIEIERETNKCIFINGSRSPKRTQDYDNYFPTFQEAKDFKINFIEKSITIERSRIEKTESSLYDIEDFEFELYQKAYSEDKK